MSTLEPVLMTTGSEYEVDEEELQHIQQVVGIKGFDSTKGKDHTASAAHAVMKVSKRKVRETVKKFKQERKQRKAKRRKI